MDEVLVYFAVKYEGNFQKILSALQNKERVSNEERKKVIESINCKYTTIISDDYPNFLKEISCPPFVLFYKGDLKTLNLHNAINIIGSENSDTICEDMTKKVVNHLAKNDRTVIVGNDEGIEKIAVEKTIKENGNLVVVLNKGINDYLIDTDNQDVLIISEYLNRKKSTKETYLYSKRLAVGLSEKVVVIEIEEMDKIYIDQVVIGSCTNGRLSDLEKAAAILKGKKVADNVRVMVVPATQKIFLQCIQKGLAEIFVEAGCAFNTPSCGPCMGGHMGVMAKGEKCVSTTNRNFVGRMGDTEALIYLASPQVAAASAIAGYIANPEKVGKE